MSAGEDTRTRRWVLNGRNGDVNESLDEVRSQLGDYASLTSTSQAAVLACPTGKTLHLDTLLINNDSAAVGTITLYDSTGTTTPIAKISTMPTSSAPGTMLTGLKGLIFTTGIYALQGSTFAQQITVGCQVRDSDPS